MTITLTPYAQELLKQIAQGHSPEQVFERALDALTEGEIEPAGGRCSKSGTDNLEHGTIESGSPKAMQ